jgi:hypothetical protein
MCYKYTTKIIVERQRSLPTTGCIDGFLVEAGFGVA